MYKINKRNERIKLAREGSDVQRLHTQRHIGEYTVGQHSFNMLCTLRIMWPDAPLNLVWAILEHDIPERLIGDSPAPAKWYGLLNANIERILEQQINKEIFGNYLVSDIPGDLFGWLKGLDILELYMWCKDQNALGNSTVRNIINRIELFVENNQEIYPTEIIDLYFSLRLDPWNIMPDLGDDI